jgi:hypothetical protein
MFKKIKFHRIGLLAAVLAVFGAFAVLNTPTSQMQERMAQNKMKMSADEVLAGWSGTPREVAMKTMEKYGQPTGMTPNMLVWENSGPWKRTVVYRQEVTHNFPMPHTDMLEQFIDYGVPADKFDDLAEYDGSVVVQRTVGEMSARCDKEEMNFLALNLANDIVTGKRSVKNARDFYAKTAMAFKNGQMSPYTQGLQFQVPKSNTAFPDQPAKMMDMKMDKNMKNKN